MTNKQRKQMKRKWGVWALCLVLLILVGGVTFFVLHSFFKDGKPEAEQGIEETTVVEEEKIAPVESEGVEVEIDETNGGKKVTQYEGDDPNKLDELTGVVTYAGVVGDNLMIRTSIDQYLDSGSCELVIMRNGQNIYSSELVAIVADASTSTCQGFDVATSQIGSGAAQIIINLSSGGKSGTLTTEVNL